jgi:anti-sigma B factor antagonist
MITGSGNVSDAVVEQAAAASSSVPNPRQLPFRGREDSGLNVTENSSALPIDVVVDRPADGVVVATVAGEVDMLTAPALRAAVLAELDDCTVLVIDLSGVSFLGSAGLAVLVEASHEAQRRQVELRLVAAGRSVQRPLEITGLTEVLTTFPSRDDAVGAPG